VACGWAPWSAGRVRGRPWRQAVAPVYASTAHDRAPVAAQVRRAATRRSAPRCGRGDSRYACMQGRPDKRSYLAPSPSTPPAVFPSSPDSGYACMQGSPTTGRPPAGCPRRLCSRGPACIVGVALDAARHSAPGGAADSRPLQPGRHRPPAQVSTSSRPTTGSRGGRNWRDPHTGFPRTGRPGARRGHRRRGRGGRRRRSVCPGSQFCGALCSTGWRSRSGERPDGERGGNREDQHCRVRVPAGVRRRPFGLPGPVHAERICRSPCTGRVEAHHRVVSTTTVPLPLLEDPTSGRAGATVHSL